MKPCDRISSEAIDDVSSGQRISPFRFSIDISLIEDTDLVGEIETALTIESAEMVLLTLRRVDEVILVAPHMVSAWKKLVDRLVQLDSESALKYVTEMSLHWNSRYAEVMIQEARGKIHGESLQKFIIFIGGTQVIGNELDIYGMNIWAQLTMERLSREGLPDIISSLLDTVPTTFFSKGYCRTPYGADYTIFQSYINPDFCKRIAETLLLVLGDYTRQSPSMVVYYTIPSAIRILRSGINVDMMGRFFSAWEKGVRIIAEEDADQAMRTLEDGKDNPFLETHGPELESLKQDLSNRPRVGAVNHVSTVCQSGGEPSSAVRDWRITKDDTRRSQIIRGWKKSIMHIAQTNPEYAFNILCNSLEGESMGILDEEGQYGGEFTETIRGTIIYVLDVIFENNSLRGLLICAKIFKEKSMILTFSKKYLFEKIIQYIDSIADSHPDLVLSLYLEMDIALANILCHQGGDSAVRISQRHQKIFESILKTAEKNLLSAIRGCEYLLSSSEKNSQIYEQVVSRWREYMKQLERRHTATARWIYSEFHAKTRHLFGYEDIAIESNAGYERCLRDRELQTCTIIPYTAPSTLTGNPGN